MTPYVVALVLSLLCFVAAALTKFVFGKETVRYEWLGVALLILAVYFLRG